MTTSVSTPRWLGTYGLPGALGTSFITLGSLGVGWFPLAYKALRWPFLEYLQTQTLGLALSRSFVVVGAAIILQAWLIVGVDTLHDKLLNEREMFAILVTWMTPLMFAAPLFSRDVYSYFMQGHLQLDGHNPYESGVSVVEGWFTSGVDPMWAESKTPYGPAFLLIEKVVAAVCGQSAFLSAFVFRSIGAIAVLVLARAVAALARRHGIDPASAMWLGVLNPLVLMHFIAGSHNDSLMIALIAVALVYAIDSRFYLAIALATCAVAIKPVALVVLPFIAIQATAHADRRTRYVSFLKVAILSAVGMVALSLIAQVGPLGWISALSTPGTVRSWLSPATAIGIAFGTLFSHVGLGDQVGHTISLMRALGLLALVATLIYLVVRPQGRSATRGAAYALGAIIVCGPVVQPWYLLWTIPLLAATGLSSVQLRLLVVTICAFTVHGIANASATADTFLEFSDGLAMLLAAATLGIAIFASPRQRALIMGDNDVKPLLPATVANHVTAGKQLVSTY